MFGIKEALFILTVKMTTLVYQTLTSLGGQ